ncbi:MAG: zinc-binding dehydrogenase [Gemmatimonadota bacterium]
MRALALTKHGGMDDLRLHDLPTPVVTQPDQVRIAVKTAALNHLDLFIVGGLPGITLAFPHIVGTDAAGIVDQVGSEVATVKPGDRVVLNPGLSCGSCTMCLSDQEPYCRTFGVIGEHYPGTAAEFIVVPERNVVKLTAGLSWPEAAALPLATLTAWRMLTTRAQLKAGETVLIWGIGGGVSLAALQIAKHLGARVVATSSSDRKLEAARALGADLLLNHGTQDIAREVRKLTKIGADVVVDSVGEKTWDTSLKSLRPGGRLVTCGATTGPHVQIDMRRLFWFQWSILGSTMGTRSEFAAMMAVANAGKLRPLVDSVTPLAEGARAYLRMEHGEQLGKLVLEVAP